MLIRGDGGRRLVSGDRIRTITTLALSVGPCQHCTVHVRQAEEWQSVLPGGTCQWRKMTQLWPFGSHAARSLTVTVMMLSQSIVTILTLCLVAVNASARPVQQSWSSNSHQVPVTLGVMSRCPDALLCETLFDSVIPRVAEKIDLSLTYIATLNASDPVFGVTCMHGPDECAGNVQQLCVAKYTPLWTWWEFVMCQNYQGRGQIGSADVALKCARTHNIDWEESGVGHCVGLDGNGEGYEGVQLLQDSVRVAGSLGITKSCTVVINKQKVCIHDGTWQHCDNGHEVRDFVDQIEEEYQKLNG